MDIQKTLQSLLSQWEDNLDSLEMKLNVPKNETISRSSSKNKAEVDTAPYAMRKETEFKGLQAKLEENIVSKHMLADQVKKQTKIIDTLSAESQEAKAELQRQKELTLQQAQNLDVFITNLSKRLNAVERERDEATYRLAQYDKEQKIFQDKIVVLKEALNKAQREIHAYQEREAALLGQGTEKDNEIKALFNRIKKLEEERETYDHELRQARIQNVRHSAKRNNKGAIGKKIFSWLGKPVVRVNADKE